MVEDPLAKFRRSKDEAVSSATEEIHNTRIYVAFKVVDRRNIRLKIRPYLRAWERIPYGYLHRIVEDGDYGEQIVLVYSFAVVVIRGRNLQRIAEAIGDEVCDFIQAFDPDRWDKPLDSKAVVIDSIDFHVETREQMVQATDQALNDIAKLRSSQSY